MADTVEVVNAWASRRQAVQQPPQASAPALWASDLPWVEADIPRRQWLAKGYLERGCVAVVAGAGAAGKSMLFKAWAIAATLGVPFHRFAPTAPLRVLTYNVEDDLHEEQRRISAALRHFGAQPKQILANLRIVGPTEIGTLIERDQTTGKLRLTDAMMELIAHIEDFKPDIVMLDPMVELHTTEENDNTGLRSVVAQLRTLATRYNVAVLVAHHVRKGAITPGDPDGVRGAGAIVGAARSVFTVCGMSEDEAKELSIPLETRKYYFRLDGAKINHAPIIEAEWFQRQAYELDNGEEVAAAVPWFPPRDVLSAAHFEAIAEQVKRGFGTDAYTIRSGSPRSLDHLCHDNGITTNDGVKKVAMWLKDQGFAEYQFTDRNRNRVKGLRAPDGEPRHVQWSA